MMAMPLVKQFQQQLGNSSEPAPPRQPTEQGTEVDVEDLLRSMFGAIRAKENDVNNEIDIVVDPPPEMNPGLSCKALLLLLPPHKGLGAATL